MIGYASVGTNDLDRARAFYDALLPAIGASRLTEMESGFTLYGPSFDKPLLGVTRPYNGEAATPGNGTMIGFMAEDRNMVDATYARALELGGSDEGAPGVRGSEGPQAFYGAYFRDLDGNKFCIYKVGPA